MSGREKLKCNKLKGQLEESSLLYLLHIKHLLAFFCMHLCARLSSILRPRNLIQCVGLIIVSDIVKTVSSLLTGWDLENNIYFVFDTFKDSLFA